LSLHFSSRGTIAKHLAKCKDALGPFAGEAYGAMLTLRLNGRHNCLRLIWQRGLFCATLNRAGSVRSQAAPWLFRIPAIAPVDPRPACIANCFRPDVTIISASAS